MGIVQYQTPTGLGINPLMNCDGAWLVTGVSLFYERLFTYEIIEESQKVFTGTYFKP